MLVAMLSACVHQQFVSEPYPRWGKETSITQTDTVPLILRTLYPADPERAPACVLLVHGMNEHVGRYHELAQYFARQYIMTGFDHFAHGLSNPVLQQADRALAQGAAQAEVSDAYLAQAPLSDLQSLRRYLQQALRQTFALCDAPGGVQRPVFIVAHSLGALVTASYLLQSRGEDDPDGRVQGVVFLAPAFAVSEPPGWRGWLATPLIALSFHAETHFLQPQDEPLPLLILNQVFAAVTVPLLDGLFEVLSWHGIRAVVSPTSPAWVRDYLTDSETEKQRLKNDHWIVRRTLLRFVKGIEEEIVRFRRHMDTFNIPYYLVYSEQDPITPAWGARDFAAATYHHHAHNSVLALPGMRYHQHAFLQEPARTAILGQIERWLDRRLKISD